LYQNNLEYTDALWDVYEKDYPDEVAAGAGRKRFYRSSGSNGVTIVYISIDLNKTGNQRSRRWSDWGSTLKMSTSAFC
jgi:predicted secreted acid phosphatase